MSSLPIQPGKTLIVNSRRLSHSPPFSIDSLLPAEDLSIQSDLSGGVLDSANTSPMQSFVLDIATTSTNPLSTATPSLNTTTRLISPLIIVSCITFAIFLAVLVGFSWIVCRYGRNAAKLAEEEEHIITKSANFSQASVELKPTAIEEERLPRAPSSKRFKRYASGRVPLGAGPILPGPPEKHSKRTSRRPSPLRHVYSAPSVTYAQSASLTSSPCPDSVNNSYSDASSSCSVDMPQTPDLDDVVVRRELFDLEDPFACVSPCISTGPSLGSLKTPMASAEQDISDAYDSCWIIGEYAHTDDEEVDVAREYVHSSGMFLSYGDTE